MSKNEISKKNRPPYGRKAGLAMRAVFSGTPVIHDDFALRDRPAFLGRLVIYGLDGPL